MVAVVNTSFTAGKIKSAIVCGFPVLAINNEIFYEARSSSSSCLEAVEKSFDIVG